MNRLAAAALAAFVACGVTVPLAGEDWKGTGRLAGRILDERGQPMAGVELRLELSPRGGSLVRTNAEGRWVLDGVAAGQWTLDVRVPGYVAKRLTFSVPPKTPRIPHLIVRLDKAPGPPSEVVEILERGDLAFVAGRWAEARAEYAKLLALRPDAAALLHRQIARSYGNEGDYQNELEHLQVLLDLEPGNLLLRTQMAQEALKADDLERGMRLLAGIDEATIGDPAIFYNVAALHLNQQKTDEAILWLTKAVTLDPSFVDGYFQRGLAYLSQQKLEPSKADLRKVIELRPASPQAETARQALAQLGR
ncbi:MAG: tetratricopeptide repeat protein [Vicinamibacteria bacterium]